MSLKVDHKLPKLRFKKICRKNLILKDDHLFRGRTQFLGDEVDEDVRFVGGMMSQNSVKFQMRNLRLINFTFSRYLRKFKDLRPRIEILCQIHHPFTSKPLQMRMGRGKGAVRGWQSCVYAERMLFRIQLIKEDPAFAGLRIYWRKLPCRLRLITRDCVLLNLIKERQSLVDRRRYRDKYVVISARKLWIKRRREEAKKRKGKEAMGIR